MTKNDAVNAIAAREFAHMFGSKNVFRLRPCDAEKGERSKVGHVAQRRELFSDDWSEARLQQAYGRGFRPKLTQMSHEFNYEDFKAEHGDDVVVLMVIDRNGVITVNTADFDLEPEADQSVLALVQPEPSSRP
ncbi:MAG: hypothetical protein P8J27_12160 [Mariniblastus sp.]|nr:hypothetical protein [Mariniblastus sp.]